MIGRQLLLLTCMLFSISVYADSNEEFLLYHPTLKHVPVPKAYQLNHEKVSVSAPVGEFIQAPILHIKINGQGPYLFMFDTGFTRSIVSKRVVTALKLSESRAAKFKVITPNQVVDVFEGEYPVQTIELGDLVIKDFALFATSGFEDEVELFQNVKGKGLDGVLGANAIYGLLTTIDYNNELLHFEKKTLDPRDPNVIPFAKKGLTPNIEAKIVFTRLKKQMMQRFLLDTGSYSYIFVNSCEIPEMMDFIEREQIMTYDYLGSSTATYFAKLFGQVEVKPGYTLDSPYITFSARLCETDTSGDFGRKFFEHHLVSINNKQGLVKIQRF